MQTLETQIETLEKMRNRWLLINLIGFIVWDGFRILDDHIIAGGLANSMTILYLVGWLTWLIGIIQLFRIGQKVKKTKMASEILNDEFVKLSRLKSWQSALIAVIFIQIAIICLPLFSISISGNLSAEITLFVAVIAALSSFIYHNRAIANG